MRDNLSAAVVRLIIFVVVCLFGTFALLAIYAQFRFESGSTYRAIFSNVSGLENGTASKRMPALSAVKSR